MKKEILAFALCVLNVITAFAQSKPNKEPNNSTKGFATINIGIGKPTGTFASTDFDNYIAGYARTGVMVDLSLGYKITPNLGITAMYRDQKNAIDINAYEKDWEDFYNSNSSNGSASVIVEAEPYRLNSFLIGIYGSFQLSNKLSIEPKVLSGYSFAILPDMTEDIYSSGKHLITYHSQRAQTSTVSTIIGIGFNYDISEEINLKFNIDYHAAYAEWNNVSKSFRGHVTNEYNKRYYDYTRLFSIVNTSIGIGFRF